ncbi:MAG: hypothetical protein LLG06_17640 [Desulfobacteraceae bacterium]|nr:hypothetical protein [Desulfobacteraceae bacterium]
MQTRRSYGQSADLDQHETFFRLINPEDYGRYGINAEDVPMGTFAAEDHPGFLPSRLGGNAYGLGLIEQEVLTSADTDFLESIDFEDPGELREHAHELNAIYQKLGLLIRFSSTGKRYFLIPINLVANSFQEIKIKADEIEKVIKQHIAETHSERLDIGILTSPEDMIAHELTARLSNQRIHIFDTLEKLRCWRIPLDIVILPKDPFEFLLEQRLPKKPGRMARRKDLGGLAAYLATVLFDVLDRDGKIHVLAHPDADYHDRTCRVVFKSDQELKSFLLFAHTFRTQGAYVYQPLGSEMSVYVSDLHLYLNRFAFSEPEVKRLLGRQKPEELTPEEIDNLPRLDLVLASLRKKDMEREWRRIFEPFFRIESLEKKTPPAYEAYWKERLDVDSRLPENLLSMVAVRKKPSVSVAALEEEIRASGMQGCSLPLVAEYRKTFRFVLEVLSVLRKIREHAVAQISELELNRLAGPFRIGKKEFDTILRLLELAPKLERLQLIFSVGVPEGQEVSMIENLEKLSLLGFSRDQLREILLIVVGHSTMSRIVFGKISAKTLKPITDRARGGDRQQVFDLLRISRLMSMAEIIASLGESFMGEQAGELFHLYDEAIAVTMDPETDWDRREDLQISSIGGVQNRAIREMLKFFNLFDFLNDWQDYVSKGEIQKEVICDYDSVKLARMEEAIGLSTVAEEFKQKFLGEYSFGQSYFFRQFLDTEFHGTGPLFRRLGTRAGFILLWIVLNASEKNMINFNPVLTGFPIRDHRRRIGKLRQALLGIPIERLNPGFFCELKTNFAEHRPAFIFDSGIRLIVDPGSRLLDVSFVDIDDNIQKIQSLLHIFESRKLSRISLRDLREMERRFSEVLSFHKYIEREGSNPACTLFESLGGIERKNREILEIETRIRSILHRQIFVPEEIYDSLSVLREHCPEILGFTIPELRGLGYLGGISPEPGSGTLEDYVMRCLKKFQALVNRDRNSFQDRNTFYRLAKREFGPLAEEGLGATHPQLEALEYYIDKVREKPALARALTFALLFQEIGKLDIFAGADTVNYWTHARQGAEILSREGLLKHYDLDQQSESTAACLVRYHGLLGHAIRGDEPITALERITSEKDTYLLDAFLVHSVLAAAAVKEGVMVSDFLECFIRYRATALEVIKSGTTWESRLREILEEKGKAVLDEFQFEVKGGKLFSPGSEELCGVFDAASESESLRQGRQSAAFDRLLRLAGSAWVDFEDLQMYLREIPTSFIYHKKKLKSVGPATFEKQLLRGVEMLYLVSSLNPEVRFYLLYCLDHLGGAMRIYDFQKLPDYFGLSESLKLLIFSLQALQHHFGIERKGGLISFADLAREHGNRHDALKKLLQDLSFPEKCFDGKKIVFHPERFGELRFEASTQEDALNVAYRDTVRLDAMRESLLSLWDNGELVEAYDRAVAEIGQRMPPGAEDLLDGLHRTFRLQQGKINERVINEMREKLGGIHTIPEFQKIRHEIDAIKSKYALTEGQLFLLDEIAELNRFRIRDNFLDAIYRELNSMQSKDCLLDYWDTIKGELFMYRSFIGKEYEILIARFIDAKVAKLDA